MEVENSAVEPSVVTDTWKRFLEYRPSNKEKSNEDIHSHFFSEFIETVSLKKYFWSQLKNKKHLYFLISGTTTQGRNILVWKGLKQFKKLKEIVYKESKRHNIENIPQ